MRWQGRRESDNVEDRRGQSGSPMGGGGGFRLPSGKGGIVLLIIVLVAGYYGVDLTGMLTGEPVSQQQTTQRSISPQDEEAAKFTKVILADTEDTWGAIFKDMGRQYPQPKLVMYRGATRTACGTGQSVMGPFYCPADSTVYIDLSFYDEMRNKLGAAAISRRVTLSPTRLAITYKSCWVLNRKCASCSKTLRRRKRTVCR